MGDKLRPTPDAKEAVQRMLRAPSVGRGRRSPIVAWMLENRATLEAGFKRAAPAWNVLAEFLSEHGITDGLGRQPTARTTREAWGRVQSAMPVPPLPDEPIEAPTTRPTFQQASPKPAMPDPSLVSDEPEPDLSQMFKVMRRPKPVEE